LKNFKANNYNAGDRFWVAARLEDRVGPFAAFQHP